MHGGLPLKRIAVAGAKCGRKSKAPEPLTSKLRASSSVFREKKKEKNKNKKRVQRCSAPRTHAVGRIPRIFDTSGLQTGALLFRIPFVDSRWSMVDTDPKFLTGLPSKEKKTNTTKKCCTLIIKLFVFDRTGFAFPSARTRCNGNMKMPTLGNLGLIRECVSKTRIRLTRMTEFCTFDKCNARLH